MTLEASGHTLGELPQHLEVFRSFAYGPDCIILD